LGIPPAQILRKLRMTNGRKELESALPSLWLMRNDLFTSSEVRREYLEALVRESDVSEPEYSIAGLPIPTGDVALPRNIFS
jgi:hypothetical protein